MSGLYAVGKALEDIERALSAQDWIGADRGIQYFAGAWLRSIAVADGAGLADAATRMKRLRMRLMTKYDVDQHIGPVQVAWMIAGATMFLSQAIKPAALTTNDTQGRILEALALANQPMTTGGIATRVGRTAATVARILPDLRAAGLVKSAAAGRSMLNQITEAGLTKYRELGEFALPPEVTDLAKQHGIPEPEIDVLTLASSSRNRAPANDPKQVLELSY